MLEIKNVSKIYAGKNIKALDNVNIKVDSGEVLGLVGPNGAGKSTLIKLIVGMLNLEDGEILVCGNSIKADTVRAKMNIGFVSDNHSVYDKLSGMEFLQFVANVYEVDSEVAKSEIDRLVTMFELENAINDSISSYSHGMKQKICIIASLLHKPKVWVLDEPLTGLDPKGTFNLKQLIKAEKERGTTILFSSHLLDMVEKLCDKVAIIDKGKVVAQGSLDEVKANNAGDLESLFLSITSKENQKSMDGSKENQNDTDGLKENFADAGSLNKSNDEATSKKHLTSDEDFTNSNTSEDAIKNEDNLKKSSGNRLKKKSIFSIFSNGKKKGK